MTLNVVGEEIRVREGSVVVKVWVLLWNEGSKQMRLPHL